ncbi:MAG: hypothetical protein IJE05_00015 [Clostridia bacterium]|nr:hypothetical protein [Clostridia bacterium]
MKKFFELAVTSRKNVNAEIYLTAEALSNNDEKLGHFDVKILHSETNGGIFVKYIPSENCDTKAVISSFSLTGKDNDKIEEILMSLKQFAFKDSLNSYLKSMYSQSPAFGFFLYACINPTSRKIKIPDILTDLFDVNITNEFILSHLGDEWLGVETKIASELQDKIHELADAKRKKEEEESSLLKNLASILS